MLVKIFEKTRFWSEFSKSLDFGQNLRKSRFFVKIVDFVNTFRKNLEFG